MILVDTSAWVEFDRATGSPIDARLTELIATTDDVAVTEPVHAFASTTLCPGRPYIRSRLMLSKPAARASANAASASALS